MISLRHLDFAGETKGELLEVAAGYGHIVIKALEAGATKIIANEIDARQLEIIKLRMPARFANQLTCSL
jgi:predicted RNA methylase